MDAIAPLSVVLVGLLGMLVVMGGLVRIVVAERRLVAERTLVAPLVPPATPAQGHGIAA